MRTVREICIAVQDQQPVTEDELRLSLLCLMYDGQMANPRDFETASEMKLRMRARESYERRSRMMTADPSVYLGPNWTPGTPENKRQREIAFKVLAAATKKGIVP